MSGPQYASLHGVENDPFAAPSPPPPPPGAGYARSETSHYSGKDESSTHGLYLADASKPTYTKAPPTSSKSWSPRKKIIVIALAILAVALAVAIPVGVVTSRHNSSHSSSSSSSDDAGSDDSDGGSSNSGPKWGSDGSLVTLDDGTNVTYTNSFGGTWVSIPYNDTARPQSFTPALSEPWDYAHSRIAGVNLGGWLLPEPFIASYLFEPFLNNNPQAVDEYTLSQALGEDLATTMENHYKTFITEEDFIEIAAAGLNWIRLPIGYWAIETWEGEPFLEGVAWNYFLKALKWARKYGLRVNLDLHAVPGSQNGLNHSGKMGSINFLSGVMGVANAQRTLNYIRSLTYFAALPEYVNLVPFFSVLNEPQSGDIGMTQLKEFYVQAYNTVRDASGTGNGYGPYVVLHDGFVGQAQFTGFLEGADRLVIDSHNYLAFSSPPSNIPINSSMTLPCSSWANAFNTSQNTFGVSLGGEWSLALNDCGHYINSVQNPSTFAGEFGDGACNEFTDWQSYSNETKRQISQFALANMDTVFHSFFWTWKIANSTLDDVRPNPPNPAWHYRLGWKEGWMPQDPRDAAGACASLAAENGSPSASASIPTFGAYQPAQTGELSSVSANSQSYEQWPPASITNAGSAASVLPTLTPTGAPISVDASYEVDGDGSTVSPGTITYTPRLPEDGNDWLATVEGCAYQDAWIGTAGSVPAAACTGGAAPARREVDFDSAEFAGNKFNPMISPLSAIIEPTPPPA